LVTACATTKIPNVKFYSEIPFQDCPEGAYVESLTGNTGIVKCEEWKQKRPFMIMIDPQGKADIFKQWFEACRQAKSGKCNAQLDSIKTVIEQLDEIARRVLQPN
jgi:hypothetical protein